MERWQGEYKGLCRITDCESSSLDRVEKFNFYFLQVTLIIESLEPTRSKYLQEKGMYAIFPHVI
jgi:hypothetical protein